MVVLRLNHAHFSQLLAYLGSFLQLADQWFLLRFTDALFALSISPQVRNHFKFQLALGRSRLIAVTRKYFTHFSNRTR